MEIPKFPPGAAPSEGRDSEASLPSLPHRLLLGSLALAVAALYRHSALAQLVAGGAAVQSGPTARPLSCRPAFAPAGSTVESCCTPARTRCISAAQTSA